MIGKIFKIIMKIIFSPFLILLWILKTPARKKARKQRDLEKWGFELSKQQREAEEYYDKWYR